MGHKRKSAPPSPIKLLSIFEARTRGVSMPEISRRTLHSVSSIMRWTEKYGDEVVFLQALLKAHPKMIDQLAFEKLYPERRLTVAPEPEPLPEESVATAGVSGDQ